MNKHDRSNVDYILSLTDDQLQEWFESISEDDRDYAVELLRMARTELTIKAYDLIENQIAAMGQYTTAKKVLAKYR